MLEINRAQDPVLFGASSKMIDTDSAGLKLLYEQNMPFWKKKWFRFNITLILCAALGFLICLAVNKVYNQGTCPNIDHNLYNTPQPKIENPVSLEYYNRTPNPDQIQMTRIDATLKQDLISMTSELNNGIKELNSEIKRLYSVLTRFDQVNRGKRGITEQTAIVDCVQMKGNFEKISADLNRISRTLSMVDENGTYHCKCPPGMVIGTPTEVTDLPMELTTFTLENINRTSAGYAGEKTKQLKKVILSDYKPQVMTSVVDNIVNNNNNKFRDFVDKEIIETPTTTAGEEGNIFTTVRILEDNIITTQKETDMITEPKEDIMSPDTSNAVTNMLNIHGYMPTVEPQTLHSEIVTKDDYEDVQQTTLSSSEALKTSTESTTSSSETIAIGTFDYDGINSTEEDEHISDKEVSSKLSAGGEDILRSTTELVPDFDRTENNNFMGNNPESTTENDNISETTTEISEYDQNENNYDVTKNNLESTTTLNDDTLKSTTETSDFNKDENKYKVAKERFELTTVGAGTTDSKYTTKTPGLNTNGSHVIPIHFELTSAKQNVEGFTTQKPTSVQSGTTVAGLKERTFAGDQDKIDFGESKDGKPVVYRPKTERTDVKGTPRAAAETTQQVQQQPKWYPVCFYPVPCPPNVLSRRKQDAQDASPAAGGTIQFSAQSLKTHKRIAPVADATVIQNSYPILSYCPPGMVCPMTTDIAGQANVLHCMLQSTSASPETQLFVHAVTSDSDTDRDEQNASNRTTNVVDTKVQPAAANATGRSAARDREEILTGDLDCPMNTFPCMDNSGCVETDNWCDGRVHCNDASDETQCNCKERIDKDKLCDGYYDCPGGEDELGCFGCNNETFSCGDWNTVTQSSSCFERQYRCDFTKHCLNGRDEEECTLLSRHLEIPAQIFFVSYSTGYLHHNWKGNWYPMCGEDQTETWAEKACSVESGEKSKPSKIQYVNEVTAYDGPYINIDGTNRIELLRSCKHQGVLVECEPEICGIRSDLKLNKNIDADRMRRSPYSESLSNATSRFARSKDPRVVGGTASNPGAWPWLIALYRDGVFHCGGVILSDQWVLTAAHCVNQYQKHIYEVQAGILRRFSFSPMEQSRTVTHVVIHTQYVRSTMENDLAMLRLEPGLEFNRWIRPVCLPDPKLDWIPFPGTICTAVGWGATVEHGPDPDNMREVEVPILAECTHKADIEGKEICAGYLSGGHDTCQGDSGGPLLCRVPSNLNKWYVAGIVSHGEGCARPMEPGVYTRVALFMDWIIKVTDDHDLPTERPQQFCPGIRCKTGKQCIPTKRQCDKYVDCMNAEDEQNCDYTGSQYHVNFYRSRNTDHSNLRYSKLKSVEDQDKLTNIVSTSTARPQSTATTIRSTNVTATATTTTTASTTSTSHTTTAARKITTSNATTVNTAAATSRNKEVQVETQTAIDVKVKNNNLGPNDTILDAIRQLFDNQFSEETFSCGRITQVVLSNHRCDGTLDCEDGSDEQRCDCKTRLASVYGQSAICDGIVDCDGGADEMGCGAPECKPDETICGRPKICVKKSAWCDGVVDCVGDGSDERHCTTITNGTTAVEIDATGRPALRRSGMVAVNRNGVWRVRCVDKVAAMKIAHDTCSRLHFTDSKYYEKRLSWNNPLPLDAGELNLSDMCHGLYVECGHARKAVDGRLYHWHADIMVEGEIVRSGVLMEDSWVLVKRTIDFSLNKTYVTAVLGNSAHSSAWIKSPYRQIARVDAVRQLPGAEFDLLHLAEPANVSAGVTPLGVPLFQPTPGPNDTCYAIGYADNRRGSRYHGTETVLLRTDAKRRCDDNALCFTVSRKPRSCSHGKNTSHVTAIVCESSNFGLFLAAPAVQRNMNFCDRNTRIQLPMAEDLMNEIAAIADKKVKSTPVPVCDGMRCELGNCVPWEKVCDGVSDCLNEQDETFEMCRVRTDKCKTNETLCICEVGSFRCANGRCTPKTTFCNGIDECGDGTDEPKTCRKNTCVDYLKLTAPGRLCDGRWDCLDKTDEHYANCPADYCNRTNVYQCQSSSKCISSEFVCDGEEDCPESDDEAECIGFIAPAKKKNEGVLATRSYGNWHAQCITEDYTDVDYHSLCRGLGFRHAVGIRKTAGTKVDFDNFTIVQLNNSTDVAVRSATKDIVQHTDRPCTVTYVVCSASAA